MTDLKEKLKETELFWACPHGHNVYQTYEFAPEYALCGELMNVMDVVGELELIEAVQREVEHLRRHRRK